MWRIHTLQLGYANAYLIEGGDALTLVDTGVAGSAARVIAATRILGYEKPGLIFLTHAHADHAGSAAELKRQSGARVAIHRADAEALWPGALPAPSTAERRTGAFPAPSTAERRTGALAGQASSAGTARRRPSLFQRLTRTAYMGLEPCEPDLLLDDEANLSRFGLHAVVLHTPGHTPGSSCLWLPEGRIAFVGDLQSGPGWPSIQRVFDYDGALVRAGQARMKALRPEAIYPGHGRPMLLPSSQTT